jgi:hypothetical protein
VVGVVFVALVFGSTKPLLPAPIDVPQPRADTDEGPPEAENDALGAALAAIEGLRLDEGTELLSSVSGSVGEVEAARKLVEFLRELNHPSPLSVEWEPTREALAHAPRTAELVERWQPGLNTYARARAAAEQKRFLEVTIQFGLYARDGGEGLAAPFLGASQRDEFRLLSAIAGVPRMVRRSPRQAVAALDMILDSPPVQRTPLGRSLEPWLAVMRDRVARRGGR